MGEQAERLELAAEKRTVLGKQVKQLRRDGLVPGVMYGRDTKPVPLQFEARSLRQLLSHVGGSQLIGVKVGRKKPETALVRDVQRDPIKGTLLHVDLYHVTMTERLRAEIPLVLEGASPVVERGEGILLQGLSALEVECLPGNLVDAIAVDLTDLAEINQAVHVSDLAIPAGIDVLNDPEEMVARVTPLAEEEVIEEVVEELLVPEAEVGEVITEEESEQEEEGEE
jgi:large subunit ribosomal protein L25